MEKIVYLTFPPEGFNATDYRDQLLTRLSQRTILSDGVSGLTVSVNDLLQDIPRPMLLLGNAETLGAAVSVWIDSLDNRAPLETVLSADGTRVDGYLVTESIPQACVDRNWADGERSPGVTHFTWFDKAQDLSDADFFYNWFEVHTPFSFELHPLRWEYVRNAVARPLTPGAPAVRAIVGERFRELRDYTDPERLFGSHEALAKSAEEAGDFSDPSTLRSLPLSEYILKTP
ncbi:hypothetical protein [Candidatus Marimicrobium litorale]|jgi:hypothetical protein|uniref:EthD domain-containing protein n=1 Tax=Candidatus Marimicrobium litorale TaxID=2518991 RepID=A0ABT3T671_9GAMM|nr:hypothetical protein [Candidatus Marimicrobium litorale]MCX2976979.1 hypothetical protein [Candidatus Marimicrobium litorale]